MLTVLDLFSGIGGFSLGLERAGMRTIAFCEIDPYCRAVLAKHWPDVPIHGDIRTLDAATVVGYGLRASSRGHARADVGAEAAQRGARQPDGHLSNGLGASGSIDLICGGFPCQPFSAAGKRRGAEDDRHLWPEMARVISEVRPSWVIGENVTGIIGLALDGVLSDLEGMGYAVWPVVLPACAVDAPHRRDRIWIVAHAVGDDSQRRDAPTNARNGPTGSEARGQQPDGSDSGEDVAHADSDNGYGRSGDVQVGRSGSTSQAAPDDNASGAKWLPEPDVGRVAHGVPNRVDRLRALGNSIVPQVVTEIGRAIMRAEEIAA